MRRASRRLASLEHACRCVGGPLEPIPVEKDRCGQYVNMYLQVTAAKQYVISALQGSD